MNKHVAKLLQPGVFWYCLIMLAFAAAAALFDQYYLAVGELVVTVIVMVVSRLLSVRRRNALMRYVQSATDAEAKRTHKFQRTASASPTPSRRISPWLSAKAVLLVPLRPPHRPGQTASSASGCLHPQMQSVCAALRLLKKMGTLFMLHGSIAQHLQKVYKIFRYFLSIP